MVLEFSLKGKSIREEETTTSFSESVFNSVSCAFPSIEPKSITDKKYLFFI